MRLGRAALSELALVLCLVGRAPAQERPGTAWGELTRWLPEETILSVASRDLATAYHETVSRLERAGMADGRGELDRDLIRMLPARRAVDRDQGFLAALDALGLRPDGAAAFGLLVRTDPNGRTRIDDDDLLCILPIARIDLLTQALQADAPGGAAPQKLDGVTLMASDRQACAYTDKALLFGSAYAVRLAVETYAGRHRAIRPPPPGDGLFLLNANPGRLAPLFRAMVLRESRGSAPDDAPALSPPATRTLEMIEACEGFSVFAALAGDTLTLKGNLRLQKVDALARLLASKSAQLSIIQALPPDAPLVFATSLTPELLTLWGNFMASMTDDDPQLIAAISHLAQPLAGRQCAFAFTGGQPTGRMPNLLCVAEARDDDAAEAAYEALSCLIVSESKQRFTVARSGGAEIRSFPRRRGDAFHAARSGRRILFALDSLAIEQALGQPQATTTGVPAVPEVAAALGPEGVGGVLAFVDFPRLLRCLSDGKRAAATRSEQTSCVSTMRECERQVTTYHEKLGRFPADLASLAAGLQEAGVPAGAMRTKCPVGGNAVDLVLDTTTGTVACPNHGTVKSPKSHPQAASQRPTRDEPLLLRVLGRVALRLNIDSAGGEVVGRVTLDLAAPPHN